MPRKVELKQLSAWGIQYIFCSAKETWANYLSHALCDVPRQKQKGGETSAI